MLQHFIECIKQAKSVRQQAVQMNIFTSVLCALKVGTETAGHDFSYFYLIQYKFHPDGFSHLTL